MKRLLCLASVWLVMAGSTGFAIPVTPSGTFGSLPAATFGGIGNPNSAVEVTTIANGGGTITLGLAAQQRYTNPSLANNGAGIYYATPGANAQGSPPTVGSTWNFDFYVNVAGGGNVSGYTFYLLYSLKPDVTPTGSINLNNANTDAGGSATTTTLQDSENLTFAFLATGIPGAVVAPAGPYDPNATGYYGFVLEAYQGSTFLGESAIDVDVVPEVTSTSLLFCLGLATLLVFEYRLNRRQSVS